MSKMKRSLSATYSRAARRRTLSASTGVPLIRKLGELSDSSSSEDDRKSRGKVQPGAKRYSSNGDARDRKENRRKSLAKQSIGESERDGMERGTIPKTRDASPSEAIQSRDLDHGGHATAHGSKGRRAGGPRKSIGWYLFIFFPIKR